MKILFKYILLTSTFCLQVLFGQTFNVQFYPSINDGTNLQLEVQVRLNTPPEPLAYTLNSVTFDVYYSDATATIPGLLTFIGPTDWAFTIAQGYATTTAQHVADNKLRITIIGNIVGLPSFNGYDVLTTFDTWVKLNFTHTTPAGSAAFSIEPSTASISLFDNPGNAGNSGANTEYNPPALILSELNVDPLPVELSSFTVNILGGTKAELKWATTTEVNNYGFDVERKTKNKWEKIGFVQGNGNSNSPKEYSYVDNNLFGGCKFQYRLKQIDNDGQFEYSDVVEVEAVPTKYELSQNYPNPFNPNTTIRFSLPKQTQLKINIYNMLGELVEKIAEGNYEAGYYKVNFNASNLPSGTYIYRIESNEFIQSKKMIMLK
jgi:hypothetical protein